MHSATDSSLSLQTGSQLLAAWLAIALVSAIGVQSGVVWAAETTLPLFLVVWLAATARSFPLSRLPYASIFVFLALHQVGAHFSYPEVPLPSWLRFTGASTLEAEALRNPYDRIVHFAYGLLFTYPLREVAYRLIGVHGTSVLGAQGDRCDTHWDLLLATAGSLIGAIVIVAVAKMTKRTARAAQTASL